MRRLAALAAVVVAFAGVPGGIVGGAAACAAEENRFAVVVDFGDTPGAPSGNTVTCVVVDGDDTAAEALEARARMLGRPAPRYNNAGLLCSLDGFPDGGCGERTAAGYRYWSYWFGGDGWSYASTGPAFHRAKAGGVVGWRFQPAGTATASDPPPRASARFAELCTPVASASPPTTAVTARPRTTGSAAATSTTTVLAAGKADAPSITSASAPASPSSSTTSATEDEERTAVGAAPSQRTDRDDDSSWPVAVGGVAVAAALGGAAIFKSRRR